MRYVAPARLTSTTRWRRLFVAIFVAGVTGAAAAAVRSRIGGLVHYESIVALFGVLPLLSLSLTIALRRVPWRCAVGQLVLELSAAYLAFLGAWVLVLRPLHPDVFEVVGVFWLVAVVCCVAMLVAWQQFRRPKAGPCCPGCGYCLIGAPADRCPECGREFDVHKVGVSRE